MLFQDMGARSRPPDGASVIHHGTDHLFVQQNTIPVGKSNCLLGDFNIPTLSAAFFLTWLIWVEQVNRLSKFSSW